MKRRSFVQLLTAGTAGQLFLDAPRAARAQSAKPKHVVVIGGGMAGTSVAKYLALWGQAGGNPVDVTLVTTEAAYVSCIMSNKVLTGHRDLASLTFGYEALSALGVTVVTGTAGSVDPSAKTVTLSSGTLAGGGSSLTYDRLVLAPGIDFVYKSWDAASETGTDIEFAGMTAADAPDMLPHAWKAGPQTETLRRQLDALPDGRNFVITIPKAPYRCPPGPYERACVLADWLRDNKPKSRVIVLDENPKILVEPLSFGNAFMDTHKTNLAYFPNASIAGVTREGGMIKLTLRKAASQTDARTGKAIADAVETIEAGAVNLIPWQTAGSIVLETFGPADGLDKTGRWAVIDERSYAAKAPALAGIHVVGDSIASAQPKAGHIGNQEAKVCADAILRMESDTPQPPYATPVTNSACYTPVTATTATWLTAVFAFNPDKEKMELVDPPGVAEPSGGVATAESYKQMEKWFEALMVDAFG